MFRLHSGRSCNGRDVRYTGVTPLVHPRPSTAKVAPLSCETSTPLCAGDRSLSHPSLKPQPSRTGRARGRTGPDKPHPSLSVDPSVRSLLQASEVTTHQADPDPRLGWTVTHDWRYAGRICEFASRGTLAQALRWLLHATSVRRT